jgi:hypothetical protein
MASENNRKTKPAKGPKVAKRPKAISFFQPDIHGLLLRRIGYDAKGQAIPGIHRLFNSLIQRFGCDDVLTLLAAEMAVADYARLATGLKTETIYELSDWYPSRLLPITRHINSSRRHLDNSVKLLRELDAERAEEQVYEEALVDEDGELAMSEDESHHPRLTKDDLFSEQDWSATSSATLSDEGSGPPANVAESTTEEASAADTTASAQQDGPVSESQTYTPTEYLPADAGALQSEDAAKPETEVSQSTDGAGMTSDSSPGTAEGGLTES